MTRKEEILSYFIGLGFEKPINGANDLIFAHKHIYSINFFRESRFYIFKDQLCIGHFTNDDCMRDDILILIKNKLIKHKILSEIRDYKLKKLEECMMLNSR